MSGPDARIRTDYRRLAPIAWVGMFVFGLAMALLGAILPVVTTRLALDLRQAGSLFSALNAAMLGTVLWLGPLMDRRGTRPVLAGGSLASAAGMAVVALARSYPQLLAGLALLGAGGVSLNVSTNTLVADLHPDPGSKSAALNFLGVFFGIGALAIPLAIGRLIEALGLHGILFLAAAISLVPGLAAVAVSFPPKPAVRGAPTSLRQLACDPLLRLFAALLFLQSGSEFILSGYTSLFLTREVRLGLRGASYCLAGYWAAFMCIRVLLSFALPKTPPEAVVRAGSLAAAGTVLLLANAREPALAAVALVATGASSGSIYPTVLGQAGSCFASRAGSVYSLLFAVTLVGGATLPWIVGAVAETFGLRAALLLAALNAVGVYALQGAIRRRWHGQSSPRETTPR